MKCIIVMVLITILVISVCYSHTTDSSALSKLRQELDKAIAKSKTQPDSLFVPEKEEIIFSDPIGYPDSPEPINPIAPEYPPELIKTGIEGIVYLEVEVFKDGSTGKIKVLRSLHKGQGGLDEAAIAAVKQWKFQPGKDGGKPIDTVVIIPIEFIPLRSAPQLKSIVLPDYPDSLVQAGFRGTVIMKANIARDGNVYDILLIDSVFDKKNGLIVNAIDAFGKWRFEPSKVSTPKENTIRVELTYKILNLPRKFGWYNIKVEHDSVVVPLLLKKDESFDNPPFAVNPKFPKYPAFAYLAFIEGIVVLEVNIDEYGIPDNIKVVRSLMSGPGGLDEAAVEAVKKWKFTPALKNGYPVDVTVHLPIEFIWANKGITQ